MLLTIFPDSAMFPPPIVNVNSLNPLSFGAGHPSPAPGTGYLLRFETTHFPATGSDWDSSDNYYIKLIILVVFMISKDALANNGSIGLSFSTSP
jgi:hypothetical protein